MRVLFLTTGDSVKGVISDDGFVMGRFTLADTISLVLVATVGGIFGAFLYLAAQPFIAGFRGRTIPMASAFYGVFGGALIVKPEGVDFVLLEPVALAIALFVFLPAVYGAIVSWLVNRAMPEGAWPDRLPWWVLGPPLLLIAFPPVLLLTLVAVLSRAAEDSGRVQRFVRAGALVLIAAVFAIAAVNLGRDASELL